jgi:tetratricopeptide (TPR) repeat protein
MSHREAGPDLLVALEEERDFLLRSLDDLDREHDAGDVGDADYQALRDDYTARAAAVIRRIEARNEAVAATRPHRPRRRAIVVGVAVVLLGVMAGVLVAQASGRRAPGEGITGDIRQTSRDLLLTAQQDIGQANAALRSGDSEEAVASFRAALDAYDRVLDLSPTNTEALTYKGWLLHQLALLASDPSAGSAAELEREARSLLDQAIEVDPSYPDSRVFRAILARNAGDDARARADLDSLRPGQIPPFMEDMVDGLRADVGAGPEPSGGEPVAP